MSNHAGHKSQAKAARAQAKAEQAQAELAEAEMKAAKEQDAAIARACMRTRHTVKRTCTKSLKKRPRPRRTRHPASDSGMKTRPHQPAKDHRQLSLARRVRPAAAS
jgi:hypothetical protein